MIPKIIHYCWFGGTAKPPLVSACIKSWKKRNDYEVVEWSENNCNVRENEFVSKFYDEKKYAFLSDYFRLKALYDRGGIYLDTDVYAYRSFDDLLGGGSDIFLGWIYDCALGTAVIGASAKSALIGELLNMYNARSYGDDIVNNGIVTDYFLDYVPGFLLNGKRQTIDYKGERIDIYPKEEFETGKVFGRSHTLHFADGSWHRTKKQIPAKWKLLAARMPINIMAMKQKKKADTFMTRQGKYQAIYNETVGKKNS